jgi:O-antigen/teichoic acid export membrane protein
MSVAPEALSITPEPQVVVSRHAADTRDALVRNISFDMAARAGYLVSRVFIPPFVLARVGLPAYSLWSAVFLLVSYVGVTSLGFSAAYVKFVAEFIARGETRKANSILSTGLLMCFAVCGSLFALVALGMPRVLWWFAVPASLQAEARYLILLVVGIHLGDVVTSVFKAVLLGCQKIVEVQSIWVFTYLLEAVLIFYLVGSGHGLYGLADAFAVSTVASIILAFVVTRRKTPWVRLSPRLYSRESQRMLMNFGGVVQLGAMLSNAIDSVERALAAPLIGLEAVGLLDIGGKLPRMSTSIPIAFAAAFVPAAAYLQSGLADTPRAGVVLRQLYLKGSRYMTFSAATLSGIMATASAPLLSVWVGRIYPGTAYLMTIFAVQQQLRVMTGPGTAMLRGIGRPWEEFVYVLPNLVLAAVMIPLSRLVIGRWSAVGLGTAMAIASVVASLGFIFRANRIFDIRWREYFRAVVMPSLMPYLVGGLVAIPLGSLVAGISRWRGAAVVCLAGTTYLVIVALVADQLLLASDERLWFHEIIRHRSSRILGAIAARAN